MTSGFAKTYRKVLISDVWKMPPLYHRVFQYLILKAKYKVEEFPTRRKYCIYLLPGQLITSMDLISQEISWYEWGVEKKPNKKTIKDILEWLEGNSMVTVVSNRHGTFIEVVNWLHYHGGDKEKVTQSNGEEVTPEKRALETIKEVKEVKELKELSKLIRQKLKNLEEETVNTFLSDSYEYRLAKLLREEILKRKPDHKAKKANLQSWAKHIDGMIRLDNRKPKQIAVVIKWCQQDSFWQTNIESTSKLRDQFDKLEGVMKNDQENQKPEERVRKRDVVLHKS